MKAILELRIIDLGERVLVVQVLSGLDNVPKFTNGLLDQTVHQFVTCGSSVNDLKRELAKHLDKLNAEGGEYRVNELDGRYYAGVHCWQYEAEAQAECDRLNHKPPVPRLELSSDGLEYVIIASSGRRWDSFAEEALPDLEQIIGHPIPVYEPKKRYKGTWTLVAPRIITSGDVYTSDQALTSLNAKIEHSMSGITIYKYIVEEC